MGCVKYALELTKSAKPLFQSVCELHGSEEVVLAVNSGEVVTGLTLGWRSHGLEASERLRVMHTLLEKVELGFTDAHLSVHLEETFTSIVEWVIADRLELQILCMAPEQIESLSF